MVHVARRAARLIACTTLLLPSLLRAQGAASPGLAAEVPGYAATFDQLWSLRPDPAAGGAVGGVTVRREAAEFHMESGQVNMLVPVNGRAVGFVWAGSGRFRYAPAGEVEAGQLARYFKQRALDIPITGLVVLFTDSTAGELGRLMSLGAKDPAPDMQDWVREALQFLGDEGDRDLHVDLMRQVLNEESRGLFIAHITRRDGDPLMFEVNPSEREGVQLFTRSRGTGGSRFREVVAAAPLTGGTGEPWQRNRRHDVLVRQHTITVSLPNSSSGDVNFAARDQLTLWADDSIGAWQPLRLYWKLQVDSATWGDGTPASVHKGKESGLIWVRLPRPMARGDSAVLNLVYHGDLTDRYGDYFYIKGQSAWYPRTLDYRDRSTFDITYRTPKRFAIASIGTQRDSTVDGPMLVTRWVTDQPVRNASFNFGLLKSYRVAEGDLPPVTVLWSVEGHRAIAQALGQGDGFVLQEKDMEKRVATDITGAIRFFESVYGPAPMQAFHVTETPALHGLAFPGLVHLSYSTFVATSKEGWDEAFRAHEVAHQWWGIGVDFATYRDQWLSEGFSDFSGLWYLQAARQKPDPYFAELRRWRGDIVARAGKSGPISLGYRAASARDDGDYQTVVYKKGAWVLHMLRTLLIDLRTMNEDRFTAVMRDFYQTYTGRYATTADFQRTVEKHVGQPMDWFFQQWVDGTAIPTYKVSHVVEPVADGKFRLKLTVLQEGVPEGFRMFVPVTVEFENGSKARLRILVTGARSEPELPPMPARPKAVKFNDFEGVLATVQQVGE